MFRSEGVLSTNQDNLGLYGLLTDLVAANANNHVKENRMERDC